MDSNEDGFKIDNVEKICSARESTKTTAEGYIGEKGIGFKYVFTVASKVHIQSGFYSFSFEHQRGNGGDHMGLITPLDESYHEIPANVNTRMTLTLSNPSEFEDLARKFTLPLNTLVLFLTKLKKIVINRHDSTGLLSTNLTYEYIDKTRRGKLKITDHNDSSKCERTNIYHIAKRTIPDLPNDNLRTYKVEEEIIHINEAEVVLAFPLDEQSLPLIEEQEVFAFLPMRDLGFKVDKSRPSGRSKNSLFAVPDSIGFHHHIE